jgi:hypothetical protein
MSAATHDVLNQSKPLVDYNAFTADEVLVFGIHAFDGAWGRAPLSDLGETPYPNPSHNPKLNPLTLTLTLTLTPKP